MYDDATHADLTANDHTYSVMVTVSATAGCETYPLCLTARDATDKQDQTQVSVEVVQ